ncbi:hypothetical protein CC2G_011196 [Coprinopsis cinerea AmutBmut pab1-1]|nr:hypothetical protein CC2G_011196 [Coprinopsis cinerea AmutBmut pab1-1]
MVVHISPSQQGCRSCILSEWRAPPTELPSGVTTGSLNSHGPVPQSRGSRDDIPPVRTKLPDKRAQSLQLYDWFDTVSDEVSSVWASRMSIGTLLYFIVRYSPFVDVPIFNLVNFKNPSDFSTCQPLLATGNISTVVGISASEGIITMALYALLGRKKKHLILLSIAFFACSVTVVVLLALFLRASYEGAQEGRLSCLFETNNEGIFIAIGYFILLGGEILIAAMSIWLSIKRRNEERGRLIGVLYRNGALYIVAMLSCSVVNAVTTFQVKTIYPLNMLQRVMHSVLASRLFLKMRTQITLKPSTSASCRLPVIVGLFYSVQGASTDHSDPPVDKVASGMIFLYDWFDTITREVSSVWTGRLNIGAFLYLVARYSPFIDLPILNFVNVMDPSDVSKCRNLLATGNLSAVVGVSASEGIIIMVIYALLGSKRIHLIFFSIAFVACNVAVAVLISLYLRAIDVSVKKGQFSCVLQTNNEDMYFAIGYFILVGGEIVLAAMSIWISIQRRNEERGKLLSVLYRDGGFYIVAMLSCSVVNAIITYLMDSIYPLNLLQRVMHSVLASRLFLNMRAQARPPSQIMDTGRSITNMDFTPMSLERYWVALNNSYPVSQNNGIHDPSANGSGKFPSNEGACILAILGLRINSGMIYTFHQVPIGISTNDTFGRGARNCPIVVDDRDGGRIRYSGDWVPRGPPQIPMTVHSTWAWGARASFTFRGTHVAVFGTIPQGNGQVVGVDFQLDGGQVTTSYRRSTERAYYNELWYQAGPLSPDEEHTVTLVYRANDMDFQLDRIEYEPVPPPPPTSSRPTLSLTTSVEPSSSSHATSSSVEPTPSSSESELPTTSVPTSTEDLFTPSSSANSTSRMAAVRSRVSSSTTEDPYYVFGRCVRKLGPSWGGALGGLFVLAVVILSSIFCMRKVRKSGKEKEGCQSELLSQFPVTQSRLYPAPYHDATPTSGRFGNLECGSLPPPSYDQTIFHEVGRNSPAPSLHRLDSDAGSTRTMRTATSVYAGSTASLLPPDRDAPVFSRESVLQPNRRK